MVGGFSDYHVTSTERKISSQVAEDKAAAGFKSLSDNELIDALKEGYEDAFFEIVNRYQNPIVNYLYRILRDYEEAVDLAQETFVRIYFAVERYRNDYSFSTYIYRIATNLAISELRRRKRQKLLSLTGLFKREEQEQEEFDLRDSAPSADAKILQKEMKERIASAIYSLPEKYRLPIILCDIEGKSYEEVAKILNLGLGTTKSRISRARGLLREKLKDYFGDERNRL
ncbi:MAG: sigma-70 family RNA polymerase sigma factor [Acidobacteria bacterium]|jgi:RNA polymerase sigma-70 factor (ECF subfamily)|nr:MAG: sigma-70 family RNA polymerase sigma factor [Acidobacteriota bacterium]GIU82563.1 MAG: RNA polymerase subunit sigma-24 [Pyrinomonadaceae bacterium]